MRSRLTAGKLLLIAPALFLMLQVSLALHHHHSCSYHDDQGYFHSVSTTIDKHVAKIDSIIGPKGQYLLYCLLVTDNVHLFLHSPEAVVFTTPSHSRAPPNGTRPTAPSPVIQVTHELIHFLSLSVA